VNKFGDIAVDVMKKELQQMIDKKVWRPVIVSHLTTEERQSITLSSIFLKEKYKSSGEFDKLKARLVAGGHRQDKLISQKIISASDDIKIYSNKLLTYSA
jgi:hypothetical protein